LLVHPLLTLIVYVYTCWVNRRFLDSDVQHRAKVSPSDKRASGTNVLSRYIDFPNKEIISLTLNAVGELLNIHTPDFPFSEK
jgi:hypothetical protein